jgi:disulfide bond formation protein DsbB
VRYSSGDTDVIALYVLVVGAIVGAIASRGNPRLALLYVPIATLGAILGAFAAFGDAPFLLHYRFINPFTLALLGSASLTWAVRLWRRRETKDR